ncbi:MAG: PIG-L family deacetylase [Deltaproteobacteria bacterium]|nr:PIG-L family deacetylase [Deltaproteobacteria bacterium]
MAGPILVVSPHLDDAVLSLGATIAGWTSRGTRVVIASVYTAGPPLEEVAPSMRQFADYDTRRAEDDAACRVIGAEVQRLGQIERAFRPPYLTGWSFFTTPADRSGFTGLPAVTAALDPLAALDPVEIHVPLGVGNHIDHIEALLAATDWAIARGWGDRLRFYEDFYALAGGMRAKHFVARAHRWRHWQSPLLRARRLGVILKTIATRVGGPPVETFLDPTLRDASWTVNIPPGADERTQLTAIACYASQTRAFGGKAGIDRALRAFHAWWGGGEPVWRATSV